MVVVVIFFIILLFNNVFVLDRTINVIPTGGMGEKISISADGRRETLDHEAV